MNIVVKTHDSHFVVRPDTTWERDSEDLYLPEFVNALEYTPVLYARICKPGRSVDVKFASRYYDGIGYGVLLYPTDFMRESSVQGFAEASCLDHTSFLPGLLYSPVTLGGSQDNVFEVRCEGEQLYSTSEGTRDMIEQAIMEATKRIYIRTGDLLAIELGPVQELCSRQGGSVEIETLWCGNVTQDFQIVF